MKLISLLVCGRESVQMRLNVNERSKYRHAELLTNYFEIGIDVEYVFNVLS